MAISNRTQNGFLLLLLSAAVVIAACTDQSGGPLLPRLPEPVRPVEALAALECTARVAERTVQCGAPGSGASRALLAVGGQGVYVQARSTNVLAAAVGDSIDFSFDATFENLTRQPFAAVDSSFAEDPKKVRVFFVQAPTTGDPGEITRRCSASRASTPARWPSPAH